MSLEQMSLLAQIISAFAVIASLIFVGIQLRQATKAVRTSSSQAHSAMYQAITASIVDNESDFARILRESMQDLDARTDDERVRFLAFATTLFRFYESSRVQWLRGQLDDEHWQMIEHQATSLAAQPGIQSWWNVRGHWHSEEFRRWFEGLPAEDPALLYGRPGIKEPATPNNDRPSKAER